MRPSALDVLRCPSCHGPLALEEPHFDGPEIQTGRLSSACGEVFLIQEGFPVLVYPVRQTYMEEDAETYDALITFIAELLNGDEADTRVRAAGLLDAKPGDRVLEVACGPGPNFHHVRERIGPTGELFALDMSPGMIRAAKRRVVSPEAPVELLFANGSYLPFADASFDSLLHLGTLNRFPDVPRALSEMARVVKPGGKVVAGDEGLGPWLAGTEYGALLDRFGGLFAGEAPLKELPIQAENVRVQWLLGHAYYVIDFRVGRAGPEANLDVLLPGKDFTVRQAIEASDKNRK
jgi:SAM-dependent methyltransferase